MIVYIYDYILLYMYSYMIIYDIMIYHVLSCTVYLKQMPGFFYGWLVNILFY